MSEYQYYEFRAVDQRLSERQMHELRSYSSRASITPTSFINEYNFGDFKGNEDAWMEKYFDGFLYIANWGTRVIQLRLPAKLLPVKLAKLYASNEGFKVRERSGYVILRFDSNSDDGEGWIEAEGVLSGILPIRDEVARGDLRALYLGWLQCVSQGLLEDDEQEPPVPGNLNKLSVSLLNLVDFLRIDPDLLAVASQASPSTKASSPTRNDLADWIATLPSKEKDELLIKLMEGGDAHIGTELYARFRRDRPATPSSDAEQPRRTVAELLKAADARRQAEEQEKALKAAEKKARREREAAIIREKHLKSIEGRGF